MNRKAFAFAAVALMVCGAFVCCSMVSDDSSAASTQNLSVGTPYSKYFGSSSNSWYDSYYSYSGSVPGLTFSIIDSGTWGSQPFKRLYVSGTPTTPGTYNVTVSIESGGFDAFPYQYTDTITFVVTNPASTVTFNANGGSCSTPSTTANNGTLISLPSASKAYCTFSGWYTAASGGTRVGGAGDSYQVSGNTTLYAQYNVIPVSITTAQSTAYLVQGTSFSYTVGTSPADASVSVSGASWLTVSGKTVTGVPTSPVAPAGTYHITVTASYGTQSAVQTFDIVVAEKLIFESVPTGGIIATPA